MTPGEAARQAQAVLRHHGYGTVTITARDENGTIVLSGRVNRLTDPIGEGGTLFVGEATDAGIRLEAGVFGLITEEGQDVFHDL